MRTKLDMSLDDFTKLEGSVRVCINHDGWKFGVVADQENTYCARPEYECPFQQEAENLPICNVQQYYVRIK